MHITAARRLGPVVPCLLSNQKGKNSTTDSFLLFFPIQSLLFKGIIMTRKRCLANIGRIACLHLPRYTVLSLCNQLSWYDNSADPSLEVLYTPLLDSPPPATPTLCSTNAFQHSVRVASANTSSMRGSKSE